MKEHSPAAQLMAVEVITELLVSTSPQKLGEVLTAHLRELSGARTVLVLAHREEPAVDELLTVSPARRAKLFSAAELNYFCFAQTPGTLPFFPAELPPQHPLLLPLQRAGVQSMVRYPLVVGGERVGLLLLLDLPGLDRIGETTQIINLLIPPIAMALKNALNYRQMQQQTLELNEKNLLLREANRQLQELDQLKSMFIASMSHELRTPLNAIIGFSSLILNGLTGEINEEQRDQLGRVHRAGQHLLALITDVIDISKIESGKVQPVFADFLLSSVVDEACVSLQLEITKKGLQLLRHCPEESLLLHSDRKRLLQCLLNFLSNAVKFTQQGTIELSVTTESGAVTFCVADTGIGIPQRELELLFQPFIRLNSPLKTVVQGTGLGLYLTRKLASEVLGGDVWASSTLGVGSQFFLRIPMKRDVAQEPLN